MSYTRRRRWGYPQGWRASGTNPRAKAPTQGLSNSLIGRSEELASEASHLQRMRGNGQRERLGKYLLLMGSKDKTVTPLPTNPTNTYNRKTTQHPKLGQTGGGQFKEVIED